MPENITSTAYMFADDTKVYRNIKTHIDREVLQSDLSRLEDWSRKWQLRCNADKCKVLHIGRDNEHYEYYMDRDTKAAYTLAILPDARTVRERFASGCPCTHCVHCVVFVRYTQTTSGCVRSRRERFASALLCSVNARVDASGASGRERRTF